MKALTTSRAGGLVLAALAGAASAGILAARAPSPAADVARGSEDAFVRGLHVREIPPRGKPQRWTRERAQVSFRHLPAGPAAIDVQLRGNRGRVVVSADGLVLGVLEPGRRSASFDVPAGPHALREVELRSETFTAGDGRQLGALLERVAVRAPRTGGPTLGLLALIVAPALVVAAAAGVAGSGGWVAGGLGAAVAVLEALLLGPSGVAYSPYTARLALLLAMGGLVGGAWGAYWERRRAGSGPWAFAALLVSVVVQLAVGASPLMVVSDAVFHANNLARVAAGDLFLTSVTQHATPFRFPYGVSFYALLAPLLRLGLEAVSLVRAGAALAGVAGAAGLFGLLVSRGPRLAALAVVLLQLLPGTLDVLSFGNLSNAFAQGLTVLFFAWWAGQARGSWALGAALLAVAATAHLSAFVVLAVLAPWLVWARWPAVRRDRTRVLALCVGLGTAGLYYASFAGLVLAQLARLGESGGSAGPGFGGAIVRQALTVLGQWGLPALLLAAAGAARRGREGLDRDLAAWWGAGLTLLAVSLATPLDVRWAYAMGPAVATAGALGTAWLWALGRGGQAAAGLLLLGVARLAASTGWVALWERYR